MLVAAFGEIARIGAPWGQVSGCCSSSESRASTSSLMACSRRCASSCARTQSMCSTSVRKRSVRRCRRMMVFAAARPGSVKTIRWSAPTSTRLWRTIRSMVCETDAGDTRSRSDRRAPMTSPPSLSSESIA